MKNSKKGKRRKKEKRAIRCMLNARNVVEFRVSVASKSEKSLFKHKRVVFSEFLVVEVPPRRHQEMEVLGQEEVAAMASIIHLQ